MNILLAKIKGSPDFFKVTSDEIEIFDAPDISITQKYSPDYKLEKEENEWYSVDNFLEKGYKNELIEKEFNSTSYNQITEADYSKIIYLCCKQGNYFLFQKLSPTQFISRKWLSISGEPRIEKRPIIVFKDFVDAVYDTASNILYFKEIAKIKPMFEGIEELYREATQKEVDDFLRHDFLTLGKGFTSKQIKTANRKRIATAMDILKNLSSDDQQSIFKYTKEYCPDVLCANASNAFIIDTEQHLKSVLFGIEQRYYTTVLGDEKRLANSVLKI